MIEPYMLSTRSRSVRLIVRKDWRKMLRMVMPPCGSALGAVMASPPSARSRSAPEGTLT